MGKPPLCTFAGYVTEAGSEIVQEWYRGLPEEEHDEILDTINYLSELPVTSWKRPQFDKVQGDLREIRCKANVANHEIRIYGVFDPDVRGRFIMLAFNECKKKDKDKQTQDLALKRWSLVKQKKASTHGFIFTEGTDFEDQKGPGRSE